jgi:hypothetical protein
MQCQGLMRRPAFAEEEKRREFARRLNEIPGVEIPADAVARRPSFDVAALADPAGLGPHLGPASATAPARYTDPGTAPVPARS